MLPSSSFSRARRIFRRARYEWAGKKVHTAHVRGNIERGVLLSHRRIFDGGFMQQPIRIRSSDPRAMKKHIRDWAQGCQFDVVSTHIFIDSFIDISFSQSAQHRHMSVALTLILFKTCQVKRRRHGKAGSDASRAAYEKWTCPRNGIMRHLAAN